MQNRQTAVVASAIVLTLLLSSAANAADTASEADKAFVAQVSQGGMYEVEASKLAEKRASAFDVKDVAIAERHDHEAVNKRLKKLADGAGIAVAADLNPMFRDRLKKLESTTADFDAAYIDDMKQIHDKDEKLFAREAMEGTEPFKSFAHQTDQIVKRHIGSLHGTD